MSKICRTCGRPKTKQNHPYGLCDLVTLSDGRSVQAHRVEPGGDLREQLGDRLKVVQRNITPEMRKQAAG